MTGLCKSSSKCKRKVWRTLVLSCHNNVLKLDRQVLKPKCFCYKMKKKKNSSIKVVFLLWVQILNKNDFGNGFSYLKPWTMFRPTKDKLFILSK